MDNQKVPDRIWYKKFYGAMYFHESELPVVKKKLVEEFRKAVKASLREERKIEMLMDEKIPERRKWSWMLKRQFACDFLCFTMNDNERFAWMELRKQYHWQAGVNEYHIVIPQGIAEKDLKKALKFFKLVSDPSLNFHITWEGQPGRKKILTERPKLG